jgi:hypothetical protein
MKPLMLLMTAALTLCVLSSRAQTVNFAVITLDTKASVSGFLHSVNDTAVLVVPGHRKKDVARIGMVAPISIPIDHIKGMVTWKVQGQGTMLLQMAAIAALSTGTTFLAVEKVGAGWGLPSSFITNMGIIFTHTQLITKRLSPKDIFFREKIEDKCIYKDERSLLAVN